MVENSGELGKCQLALASLLSVDLANCKLVANETETSCSLFKQLTVENY